MPSSLASTLGRKALCPPTLIPRKKTIKAMLTIVAAPKYRGEADALGPDDRSPVVAQCLPMFRLLPDGSPITKANLRTPTAPRILRVMSWFGREQSPAGTPILRYGKEAPPTPFGVLGEETVEFRRTR